MINQKPLPRTRNLDIPRSHQWRVDFPTTAGGGRRNFSRMPDEAAAIRAAAGESTVGNPECSGTDP
jgi:hypothetical protein